MIHAVFCQVSQTPAPSFRTAQLLSSSPHPPSGVPRLVSFLLSQPLLPPPRLVWAFARLLARSLKRARVSAFFPLRPMRSASHSHAAAAAASSSDDSFAATHAGSASASSAPSRSVPNYATLDAKIQAMQTRGTAAAAAGAAGAAEWSAPAAAASSSSSSLLRRSHSSTVHDHAAAASAASSSHSRGAGGPPLLLRSASTRAPGQVAIRDCSITSNGHASGIHMPRTSDDDVLLRIEIQYVPAHLLESQGSGAAAAPSSSMELVESMQPFSSPPCSLPHLQFPAHSSAAFVSDDPSSIGSSPAALALKREMSPSTLSNNTHSHSKKQRTNTDQTPAASCGGAASAASISASSSGASSLINSTDSIANAASSSTQSQSRKPRGALDDDDDDDEMTTMRDAPAPPTAEALVQAESFRVQCEADAHNPRVRLLWISRKTLISSSVYFAKMLEASSGWQEGRSRVINLPAADLAEAELLSGLFWSLVSPGRRFPSWFGWNRRLALLAICTYYCMEDRLAHLCDCIAHDLLKPETRVARCCEFMFRLPCATDHPRIQLLQALARKRFLEFFCEIQPAVETHTHAQREAERLTADEGSDDSSDHERASGGGHPHLLDRQRRSASRESRAALQQSHSPSAEALRPFPPPSTLTALSHFHNRWWKSSDAFAKLELPALRFLFQGMHLERDLSAVQEAAANGSLSIQPPLVLRPNPFVSSSLDCMNTMYLSLRFWVMRHHPYFVWKERRKIERIKQREEEQREKQRRELSRSASSVAAPASSSSSSAYAAAGSTPRFISPAEVEADRSLIASWLQMEPQLLSLISCIRWRSLDLDFLLNHCVALPAERESSASDGAPAKATAQAGTSCFFWHVPCVAANPRAFMSAELEREQIAAEEALAAVDASQSDALEFPDAPPVAVYAPPATACRGTCAHCVKRQAYVASAVTQALAANLTGGRRAVDLKAASTTTNNNNSANDAATAAALAASNGGGGAGLTYPTSSAPSSSLLALMKQKRRSVLGIGGVMATMGGMAHGLGGSEGSSTAAAAAAAGSAHHPRALPPSTSSHSSVDDPDQEPGTCECNTCREFVPLLMHVCTACGFSCCKACLAKLLEITSHIDSQRCPVCNAKANFYAAVQIMAPTRPRGTGASQTAAASASTGSNGSAARLELARLWSLGGLRSGGGFGDPRRLAGLLHPLDDPIEYLYSRMGAGLGGVGGAGGASDEEEEEMMLRHSLMAARHHEGEREAAIVRMLEQEHALMRAHQRATMAIQRAEGGTRATTTFSNASSRLGTRARHILRPGVDEDAELQRALLASLESLSAAGGSASPDSPWMRSATAAAEAALMRDQAEPDFLDLDQYLSTGAAAASASVPPAASTAAAASSSSHKSSAHIPVLRRLDSSSGSHSSSNGSRSSSSASRASVPSLVALPDHPLPLRSKHAPRPNSHSAAASSSSSAGAAAGATSGHPSELGVDGEDDTLMIILRPHNNPEAADIRFMVRIRSQSVPCGGAVCVSACRSLLRVVSLRCAAVSSHRATLSPHGFLRTEVGRGCGNLAIRLGRTTDSTGSNTGRGQGEADTLTTSSETQREAGFAHSGYSCSVCVCVRASARYGIRGCDRRACGQWTGTCSNEWNRSRRSSYTRSAECSCSRCRRSHHCKQCLKFRRSHRSSQQ